MKTIFGLPAFINIYDILEMLIHCAYLAPGFQFMFLGEN